MGVGGLVKTTLSTVSSSGANLGDVLNVGFGVSDYKYAREQGNNRAVSLGKAAASFAWGEAFYGGLSKRIGKTKLISHLAAQGGGKAVLGTALSFGVSIGVTALMGSGQIASAFGQHTAQTMSKAYDSRGKFGSGYFNMTEAGYTMRQRSLNAIRSNGLNTQSVLGNEARTYYRGAV